MWEYFPPNLKKEKESYVFIVYITFNITGGGLLVFLDDELTTIRNKKIKIGFPSCEKNIGSTQSGKF